ncbi:TonB-dependent receptor [Oceanobacter mangrovi]|uniref:TonB-dependent receptor n=1 Tax=Oceanobacter mangrovi TaxID=2862510 RepID=UPI001C8EBB8C|nr:TonB-dependent receptor plug domain-containing protein [Oceanobacter mangrovi]
MPESVSLLPAAAQLPAKQQPAFSCYSVAAVLTLLSCLLPNTVQAVAAVTEQTDDEIVVVGQQEPDASDLRSYSAKLHQSGYRNLGEFLESVNGVQVQALGGMGDPVLVSMQGAATNQTRILVDGVLQNSGQFGHYDLASLPLANIERIDVLNGSTDTSDGVLIMDEAIGGTINIITRKADGSTPQSLSMAAGSYGTFMANLASGWQLANNRRLTLQLDHQQSDNNYEYQVPNPSNTLAVDVSQQLNNAAWRKDRISLAFNLDRLSANSWWQDKSKQLPQYEINSPNNRAQLTSKETGLQLQGHWGHLWRQQWQLTHTLERQHYEDAIGVFSYINNDDQYRYQTTEGSLSSQAGPAVTGLDNWLFTATAKATRQTYASRYRSSLVSTTNCDSLSAQCDQSSWLQHWQAGLNSRWDNDSNSRSASVSYMFHQLDSGLSTAGSSSDDGSHQRRWPSLIAQLNQQWLSDYGIGNLQLSWKRVLRIPSIYERYGDQGLTRGNPELEPEQGKTLALTTNWLGNTSADSWLQSPSVSITVFRRQLNNAIIAIYDPGTGSGRYENANDAVMKGLEWKLATDIETQGTWQLSLAGSHYDSVSSSTIKSYNHKQLPGVYHFRLISGLQWQSISQQHRLTLNGELADDLYLDRSNLLAGDQRHIWHSSYQYQWPDSLSLLSEQKTGLTIRNLFNQQFNDFSNRPVRAREWMITLEGRF